MVRAVSVSAGPFHSLTLTADGAVWSWGGGASGKLGHGDGQDQLLPKKIEAFAGRMLYSLPQSPAVAVSNSDARYQSWKSMVFVMVRKTPLKTMRCVSVNCGSRCGREVAFASPDPSGQASICVPRKSAQTTGVRTQEGPRGLA